MGRAGKPDTPEQVGVWKLHQTGCLQLAWLALCQAPALSHHRHACFTCLRSFADLHECRAIFMAPDSAHHSQAAETREDLQALSVVHAPRQVAVAGHAGRQHRVAGLCPPRRQTLLPDASAW